MTEISDSLRFLSETTLEKRDGEAVISLPLELFEDTTLTAGEVYRVALMDAGVGSQNTDSTQVPAREPDEAPSAGRQIEDQSPPVEPGDVRSVRIDSLGDQGDGIAKVDRGFVVIVPGTQPGDRVDVEITDVTDSVAFAEPVSKAEVR